MYVCMYYLTVILRKANVLRKTNFYKKNFQLFKQGRIMDKINNQNMGSARNYAVTLNEMSKKVI